MGYTHYWYQPKTPLDQEKFNQFGKLVKRIIEASGVKIANGHGVPGTDPIFTPDYIAFNGVDADAHESAYFVRDPMGNSEAWLIKSNANRAEWFSFCKTQHKPYDKVVTASLLLFEHLFPGIRISSDGDGRRGWTKGRELLKQATGIDVPLPDADCYQEPSGPWPQ